MSNIIEGSYKLTSSDANYDSLLSVMGLSYKKKQLYMAASLCWDFSQMVEAGKWEWVWSSTAVEKQNYQFAFGETFVEFFANSTRFNTVVTLGDSHKLIVTRDNGGYPLEQTLEFSENGIDVQSVFEFKNVICKQFFTRL
jgi:hypothetical protein